MTQKVFSDIYHNNSWRSDESVSGHGSTMVATREVRRQLPILFKKYDIKSVIDIPCGDMNWISEVVIGKVNYFGIDIVPELIASNKRKFGDLPNVHFDVRDITRDPLPPVDLILCRDLLGHLCNAEVKLALKNLRASGSRYMLATTFPNHHPDGDIETGQWRPINLACFWGLLDPIAYIDEECQIEGFEDKSLGLWRIDE